MSNTSLKLAELLKIFQFSIIDLSAKISMTDVESLSVDDINDAHYIIGVATISSSNISHILLLGDNYYQKNKYKIDKFIEESESFVKSLHEAKIGLLSA